MNRSLYFFKLLILFSLFISLGSCAYRFHPGVQISSHKTVSIPYVEGDWEGHLTSQMVYEIESQGHLKYVQGKGDLTLSVRLKDIYDQNVGYRLSQDKNKITADEKRLILKADCLLMDNRTNQVILSLKDIGAAVDYDYDLEPSSNVKTMGSLGIIDMAQDASKIPLYKSLAQKITSYIYNY